MKIDGHSVFGYFTDRKDAEKAEQKLRAAGFHDTQLDSLRHDAGGGEADDPPAITGDIGSLANITLGAKVNDPDQGVLLAAHPSASGMAGDGAGPQEKNWLVVTVTGGCEREIDRAVGIIRSCGGDA